MFRSALSWKNAWRIRTVALGFIVLLVGIGSQMLANAVASGAEPATIKVTVSTESGRMADGNWRHVGACAVSLAQFPLGTTLALYNADGSLAGQCTAEDTSSGIGYGHISLVMPGDIVSAIRWGIRYLAVQVLRLGWGPAGPPRFSITSPGSLVLSNKVKPYTGPHRSKP